MIRGVARDEPTGDENLPFLSKKGGTTIQSNLTGPHQVVVTSENELVVVGVNANDRPGLLLDISRGLLRLNLSLRNTEASVVQQRSISIWRCEIINSELPDLEEIWSVLNVSSNSLRLSCHEIFPIYSIFWLTFSLLFRHYLKMMEVKPSSNGAYVSFGQLLLRRLL